MLLFHTVCFLCNSTLGSFSTFINMTKIFPQKEGGKKIPKHESTEMKIQESRKFALFQTPAFV